MSDYYQQDFVSPQPIVALCKEELSSYYSTGIISDLLIPIYVDKCLRKLGKGTYNIEDAFLPVINYQTDLPESFKYVRELWATTILEDSYREPSSIYQELSFKTDSVTPPIYCDSCSGCVTPDVISAIYKTTNTVVFQTRKTTLLEPGTVHTRSFCKDSPNLRSSSGNKFDVRGTKLTVEFEEGLLYLKYYSEQTDEEGYQLIPDNFEIQDYIEHFIKYKLFEQISNSVTDETYNQVERKKQEYKALSEEKFVVAQTDMKKRTPKQIADTTRRDRSNFRRKYNL